MLNAKLSENNIYHIAAKHSMTEILSEANKYDLNKRDENGRTPIHYAALKGNLIALKIIVTLGGKVNKCDLFGYSALHYAVRSRNQSCISFLINYEPKLIWMMDNNNLTAKQLALTLEYDEIVDLLDKFVDKNLKINLNEFCKFHIKEFNNAQKRREKYIKLMKNAEKNQSNQHHKNKFGSQSYFPCDKITIDNNIVLSSCSSNSSSTSPSSSSTLTSCGRQKKDKKKTFFKKIFNKSANQTSYA